MCRSLPLMFFSWSFLVSGLTSKSFCLSLYLQASSMAVMLRHCFLLLVLIYCFLNPRSSFSWLIFLFRWSTSLTKICVEGKLLSPCLSSVFFFFSLPSHLVESLAEYRILDCKFFPLRFLQMLIPYLPISNQFAGDRRFVFFPP